MQKLLVQEPVTDGLVRRRNGRIMTDREAVSDDGIDHAIGEIRLVVIIIDSAGFKEVAHEAAFE